MSRTWWVSRLFNRRSTVQSVVRRPAAKPGLVHLEERATPATLYGLEFATNTLRRFDSATPGTIDATVTVTGLQPGEQLVGIDFRPATGKLYAFGQVSNGGGTATGRIYTLDTTTGLATPVGGTPFTTTYPDLAAGGFNFNPTVDLIRIISRDGTNLRVSPNTGALVGTDTNLSQVGVNGVAYTNNDLSGQTTTLYGLNFDTDKLVTVGGLNGAPSPNTGQVFDVGSTLTAALDAYALDIVSSAGTETAYATANSILHTVNLATGALTPVGAIGGSPLFLGLTAPLDTIAVAGTTGNDTLVVTATGADSGSYSLNGGAAVPFAGIKSFAFSGRDGNDTLQIVNNSGTPFAPINGFRFFGGNNSDTLFGPDGGATFTVTGAGSGVGAGANFSEVENLLGGTGNDTFTFDPAGSVAGTVDGGAGADTLSYAGFSTPVSVNLGLSNNLIADLDAGQENPATASAATAIASVTYNAATRQATVAMTVDNLFNTITDFHIHSGVVGVNGPVYVPIGAGAFVPTGTAGQYTVNVVLNIPATQEATFLGGLSYFNIHTNIFPGGEIRGQIVPGTNVALATGTATGTSGVANLENVTGGAGADSLIGTNAANVLTGGAGNDTLIGGPGADTFAGEAGNDVMVWSNGDGSDVMDGGTESDTVQVNGSTGILVGDVFTVNANGTRVSFARTNFGNFTLDIGTTETLRVNGSRGDDTATVNSLLGVADLTGLSLAGLGGDDTFTLNPGQASPVAASVLGGLGADTVNVQSGAGAVGVNTGAGADKVFVGTVGAVLNPGKLTPVAGAVTIGDAGDGLALTIDGSGVGVVADYEVSGTAVTRSNPVGFGGVTYSGVSTLLLTVGDGPNIVRVDSTSVPTTVLTNAGDDTVNVLSTAAGQLLTVDTGAGADKLFVGTKTTTGSPGLLTPVAGPVTVGDADGNLALTVDGSGATATADYEVKAASVTRSTPAGFGGVSYSGVTSLLLTVGSGANVVTVTSTSVPTTVLTNAGDDTVNVLSTAAGQLLTVDTGAGADKTFVGTAGALLTPGKLTPVAGPVSVGDADGSLALTVDGSGVAVPADYVITAAAVTRSNPAGFGGVTYAGVSSLRVAVGDGPNAVNVTGTSAPTTLTTAAGDDTVRVTAAGIAAPLTVDGGDPAAPAVPGDTLIYDAGGAPVTRTPGGDPSSGSLSVPGKATVSYTLIELVTVVDAASTLTADLDAGGLLTVTDTAGLVNDLTARVDPATGDLLITDAVETFQAAPAGATLEDGGRTLRIPLALVTGIRVVAAGGADSLVLNEATPIPVPVSYEGGDPTAAPGDDLTITGGVFAAAVVTFTAADSGTIALSGAGLITFAGLEPVDMTGTTVADLVFNLPAGGSNAVLEDDGVAANGVSRLRSIFATFETTDFANPTGSLTINRGNAADTLVVNTVPDLTSTITIGAAAAPLSAINLNGTATLAAGNSLTAFASGDVQVLGAVTTTGTGAIALTSGRSVNVAGGSVLASDAGGITLSGNQQAVPTAGNFTGVSVAGTVVSQSGPIRLTGRGGDTGDFNIGVGVGGGGAVTSLGAGSIDVRGTGGASAGVAAYGVLLESGSVGSASGPVTVEGTGGGAAGATFSTGVVLLTASTITAGGTAPVSVTGTAGVGTADTSFGVDVLDAGSRIGGASGPTVVTATAAQIALLVRVGGVVTSTANGAVTLVADTMFLEGPTSVVSAGTGTVTLRPLTAGRPIDLGGADTNVSLGLDAGDLAAVTAGLLVIGDAAAGDISTSAAVVVPANADLSLVTGAGIALSQNVTATGKTIGLSAVGNILQTGGVLSSLAVVAEGNDIQLGDPDVDDVSLWVNQFTQLSGTAKGVFTATTAGPLTLALPGTKATGRAAFGAATGTLTVTGPVQSTSKNVSLYGSDLDIQAGVAALAPGGADDSETGNIRLLTPPDANATPIALGGVVAGSLSILQGDLDNLFAGRLVQIGDGFAGPLTVVGSVTAPAGFSKLVLASGGAITQNAGQTLTFNSLSAASLGTSAIDLSDPNNDVRVFTALGGPSASQGLNAVNVTFATLGDLTIGRVGLIAGVSGAVVDIRAAGSLTVDVPAVAGTPAEPTSFRGIGVVGPILLTAGKDLTVAAGSQLFSDIAVTLNLGQTEAGTLNLPSGTLGGVGPTQVTGGANPDVFNVGGSDKSLIVVDGQAPVLPTFPGDVLNYTPLTAGQTVTVVYAGSPSDGVITDPSAGALPVTFISIESLAGPVSKVGPSATDDFIRLTRDAAGTYYQYSADFGQTFGNKVAIAGTDFTFLGGAGKDGLEVNYPNSTLDPLAALTGGVDYDGGNDTGDILIVTGSGTQSATYTPDATVTHKGLVTLDGSTGVRFANLKPVAVSDLLEYVVSPAGGGNLLTVADGFDFFDGTKAALVVAGKTFGQAVDIESTSARNVGTLRVITTTFGGSVDDVTVGPVSQTANVLSLAVDTGNDPGDMARVAAAVDLAGNIALTSGDVLLAADVTVGGSADFSNSFDLLLSANTTAGGQVTQVGTGPNANIRVNGAAAVRSTTAGIRLATRVNGAGDGNGDLTLEALATAPGVIELGGPVGDMGRPNSLTVTAGNRTKFAGAFARTVANQTFTGLTEVSAAAVEFTSAVADVRFNSADALQAAVAAGSDVTVNVPLGTAGFGGTVGGAGGLKSLTVNGAAAEFADDVTTFNDQQINAQATLTGNVDFLAAGPGQIRFASTLFGAIQTATVASATGVFFGGAVSLDVLDVIGGGDTTIEGGLMTAGTFQQYAAPVILNANTTFTGNSKFLNRVDSKAAGGPFGASLVAGNFQFFGDVGTRGGAAFAPLAFLTAQPTAPTRFEITPPVGSPTGTVRTAGPQLYRDAVTLGKDTVFETKAAPGSAVVGTFTITFTSTLDSDPAAATGTFYGATVTTKGLTTFGGAVGGTKALGFLTVDSSGAGVQGGGGSTRVNGGLVSTVGTQTYTDPVLAPADVTFRSVDPTTLVPCGTGSLLFLDESADSLRSTAGRITLSSGTEVRFEGGVTAPGGLLFTCGGTIDLNGGKVDVGATDLTFPAPVLLTANTELVANLVTFEQTLDSDATGPWRLVVSKDAVFGGAVGAGKGLSLLVVGGTATVNGGSVRTVFKTAAADENGGQFFAGPVVIGKDTTFTAAGPIIFAKTLQGKTDATYAATVTTAAATVFGGEVGGGNKRLITLTVNGGGTAFVDGGLVNTSTAQQFDDNVVVRAKKQVFASGGTVTFNGTLDGTQAVDVFSVTGSAFNGSVGSTVALTDLLVTGPGPLTVRGERVVTTGLQRYESAVLLAGTQPTLFAAGGTVTFANTVDGPQGALVFSLAGIAFNKAVGGTAALASLETFGSTATVAGGLVKTAGLQRYNAAVTATADTDFTSTAAGDVVFRGPLTATGKAVRVNTAGITVFDGPVAVGSLTTNAGGRTFIGAATVSATGDILFGDDVATFADALTLNGVNVTFDKTLGNGTGGRAVLVNASGDTTFRGAVTVGRLETDAPGRTKVETATVTATGDLIFRDDVLVSAAGSTFTGANATFAKTLAGGGLITVNSGGLTTFGGAVTVGSLTTDAAGTTTVAGGSVTTTGDQTFNDPVSIPGATAFTGTAVNFRSTLDGPGGATVNGAATFGAAVGGTTKLASLRVNGPTTVTADVAFSATGDVAFAGTLNAALAGGQAVTVNTPGTTTLGGAVGGTAKLSRLTTDAGGTTDITGGSVQTVGDQTFNDPVTGTTIVFTAGGTVRLNGGAITTTGDQTFNAPVAGPAVVFTAGGGAGTIRLNGQTGTTAAVTTTGRQTYNAVVRTDRTESLALESANGVVQTGGRFVLPSGLTLRGAGASKADRATNDIGLLTINMTGGSVYLSNSPSANYAAGLTGGTPTTVLSKDGVRLLGGGFVRIRTSGDFLAAGDSTVSVPGGQFLVYPGLGGTGARLTFLAPAEAARLVFGRPIAGDAADAPGAFNRMPLSTDLPAETETPTAAGFAADTNQAADTFVVQPRAAAPAFVYGGNPRTTPGDALNPQFAGRAVTDFRYNGRDGYYVLADGSTVSFTSIESLTGLSVGAFAAQTGEAGDGTGATTQQYAIRVTRSQNGTVLPAGLDGSRLPENAFVVTPALVNPAAPTQSPRLAFGDFNGDNVPELVLANGPGTPPLVTVIDGRALDGFRDAAGVLNLNSINRLTQPGATRLADGTVLAQPILAQFYAYDPGFQGGVNVAVGKLGVNGELAIVTGAEKGGGPHVRTFTLAAVAGKATAFEPREDAANPFTSFYGYEQSFTGGVRVAVADVNGDGQDDLITTPGEGGGPRVRVFSGADRGQLAVLGNGQMTRADGGNPSFADFFTVESTFRGGLFVAAGLYKAGDTKASIVVGAASGGGPRVMVFDTASLTRGGTPTVVADFFAFSQTQQGNPLLGDTGGFFSGVGGVSFGPRGANGYLNILASTARGPDLVVRQFDGGSRDPLAAGTFIDLTDPALDAKLRAAGQQPLQIPQLKDVANNPLDPSNLNYGATVAGYDVS